MVRGDGVNRGLSHHNSVDCTAKINDCLSFIIINTILFVDLWSYHSYYLISDYLSQNECIGVIIKLNECSRFETNKRRKHGFERSK